MPTDLITQAAFAATMGVDRSQVTLWKRLGMPTATGGLVDPVEASRWVRCTVDPSQRERRSIGAAEERNSARRRQEEATDELMRLPIWLFCRAVPALVASAAEETGVQPEQRAALEALIPGRAADLANRVREMCGVPPGEMGPFRLEATNRCRTGSGTKQENEI